jgi:hypothetical protein
MNEDCKRDSRQGSPILSTDFEDNRQERADPAAINVRFDYWLLLKQSGVFALFSIPVITVQFDFLRQPRHDIFQNLPTLPKGTRTHPFPTIKRQKSLSKYYRNFTIIE